MTEVKKIDTDLFNAVNNSEMIVVLVTPDGEIHYFSESLPVRQVEILRDTADMLDAQLTLSREFSREQ